MCSMERQKKDIITKELMNRSELIRFVRGPERRVFADLSENLPGRGMWVKGDKESLQTAIDQKLFNKACHSDCQIEDAFIEGVASLLQKRVLNLISLSKKCGALSLGFDKVMENAKEAKLSIFIIASDSGEDGKHKIEHHLSEDNIVIDKFTGAELQAALGQDSVVVYGAIKKSKIAKSIIPDYKKLLDLS